jgi:putative oxidoreductase
MARKPELGTWIEIGFRLVLAGFFIIAGVMKIKDPQALTAAIETYQLLPYQLSVILALFLPWLEVTAGIGIILKRCYRGSLLMLILMLIVFVIALTQGWIRDLDVTCGCFGNADQENQTNYAWLIVRDLLLILLALTLWIRHSQSDKR